jgi:hypothetical protein
MLSNNLNTNEVKNAAGVEVEFVHNEQVGRKRVFQQIAEAPSLPHRLTINHSETGAGLKRRRRSMNRFDKTVISTVDGATPVTVSAIMILDAPVGALETDAEMKNVLAELLSFNASLGATTTILYDCTGNGAVSLVQGQV